MTADEAEALADFTRVLRGAIAAVESGHSFSVDLSALEMFDYALSRDHPARLHHQTAQTRVARHMSPLGDPAGVHTADSPGMMAMIAKDVPRCIRAAVRARAAATRAILRHRAELVAAARGLDHLRPVVPALQLEADADEVRAASCTRAAAPPGVPLLAVHLSTNAPPRLGAGVFCRTPRRVT